MATIQVSVETRDTVQALKESFGFDNADEFVDAAMAFIEEHGDEFDEFVKEDEDEDEDEEE